MARYEDQGPHFIHISSGLDAPNVGNRASFTNSFPVLNLDPNREWEIALVEAIYPSPLDQRVFIELPGTVQLSRIENIMSPCIKVLPPLLHKEEALATYEASYLQWFRLEKTTLQSIKAVLTYGEAQPIPAADDPKFDFTSLSFQIRERR